MASPTAISRTSLRTASPYRCRIIDGGTFPGRKPGIETLPDTSSSLALSFVSTSFAGTMILSSWLKPSFFISVTSMALYSPVLHYNRRLSFANRTANFRAWLAQVVRAEGIEPPRIAPQVPKTCASTSSATPARPRAKAWTLCAPNRLV